MPHFLLHAGGHPTKDILSTQCQLSLKELFDLANNGDNIFLCRTTCTEWKVVDEGVITILNGQSFLNGEKPLAFDEICISPVCQEYNAQRIGFPPFLIPGDTYCESAIRGDRRLLVKKPYKYRDWEWKPHPYGFIQRDEMDNFCLVVVKPQNSQGDC